MVKALHLFIYFIRRVLSIPSVDRVCSFTRWPRQSQDCLNWSLMQLWLLLALHLGWRITVAYWSVGSNYFLFTQLDSPPYSKNHSVKLLCFIDWLTHREQTPGFEVVAVLMLLGMTVQACPLRKSLQQNKQNIAIELRMVFLSRALWSSVCWNASGLFQKSALDQSFVYLFGLVAVSEFL